MQMRMRQAILMGLAPLLREDQLATAMELLEENFANEPSFNLQKYVDRLHGRLAPHFGRRDLQRALVKSVFLGEGAQEGPSCTVDGAEVTPAVRVFGQLLGRFLAQAAACRPAAEIAVRRYLIDKLAALTLPPASQDALLEWLGKRQSALTAPLAGEEMRRLLNLTYVLVCEYLGPVEADRLLAVAVREAEALPEARLCPPRTLL